jgi:hypothetical protein
MSFNNPTYFIFVRSYFVSLATPNLDHAQLMRLCQIELSRHNQGPDYSRDVGATAEAAATTTQLSSNAAVLISAAQQHGMNGPNIDRLSHHIAMNLEQIKSLMNSNETAAAASPLAQQGPSLPQMTGIRHNMNGHATLQQRQMLVSSHVSPYARLQQRQQDAVAAAATMALLRREQEQRLANVAAQNNHHQQQYRIDQLQRELQSMPQLSNLRNNYPSTTHSLVPPSLALSLARNPMVGTNMAMVHQHQQQQHELSSQMMMMMTQHANMPTSATSTNLYPLTVNRTFGTMSSHDEVAHTIPLSHPVCLAQSDDEYKLSDHQYFLRQQIEAFPATEEDVMTHTRGRNKPIHVGQVGIRCRYCAHIPVSRRQKGATYFPSNKLGIYQAAQNMSTAHIQCGLCTEMPEAIKLKFIEIMSARNMNCSNGAGRPYWAQSATQLGLIDTEEGIRFIRDVPPGIMILE